jgi:hypothetical protein
MPTPALACKDTPPSAAAPRPAGTFATPNPHLLACLGAASAAGARFVARCDIVDVHGHRLWDRDQAAAPALLQRLQQRTLATPLESCLCVVGGVGPATLLDDLRRFNDGDHPLAVAVRPWRGAIEHEAARLTLHPVVQLLLSAARSANEGLYRHAVAGMALAGALAAGRGSARYSLRLALLGGLLHDIGELYLHPQILDPQRVLDRFAFRQLSAHPRIGSLLLSELTDHPRAVALAIDEHHERLDGSGYPARRAGDRLSELGRLLAVVEVVQGSVASARDVPLTRAAFGLGFVPEQFEQRWTETLRAAAFEADEQPHATMAAAEHAALAQAIAQALERAEREVALLAEAATPAPARTIGQTLAPRLAQLRRAWPPGGASSQDAASVPDPDHEMLVREMAFRLRGLQRDLTLLASGLAADEAARTQALSNALELG